MAFILFASKVQHRNPNLVSLYFPAIISWVSLCLQQVSFITEALVIYLPTFGAQKVRGLSYSIRCLCGVGWYTHVLRFVAASSVKRKRQHLLRWHRDARCSPTLVMLKVERLSCAREVWPKVHQLGDVGASKQETEKGSN